MRNLHKATFDELYKKWVNSVGDPEKNLTVSKTGNAIAWRMGFFYLARVIVVDCLKLPAGTSAGDALRSYDYKIVMEITKNTILN